MTWWISKLARWVLATAGAGILLWSYCYLSGKILPIERLDDWVFSPEQAQERFNARFPSDQKIKAYLTDATLLLSHVPFGQSVNYFDSPYHFLRWQNDNTSETDLVNGAWFTDWYLLPMTLKGRWRIALVHSFCTWFPDRDLSIPQDRCVILGNPDQIFAFDRAAREYRKGNVFHLSAEQQAPFPLPNKTPISIDGLLSIEHTKELR